MPCFKEDEVPTKMSVYNKILHVKYKFETISFYPFYKHVPNAPEIDINSSKSVLVFNHKGVTYLNKKIVKNDRNILNTRPWLRNSKCRTCT